MHLIFTNFGTSSWNMHACMIYKNCLTIHRLNGEGWVALQIGQLVLKLNRNIAFQGDCLSPGLTDGGGGKLDMSGKFSRVEYRVGMDGNEQVLLTLWCAC